MAYRCECNFLKLFGSNQQYQRERQIYGHRLTLFLKKKERNLTIGQIVEQMS